MCFCRKYKKTINQSVASDELQAKLKYEEQCWFHY